MTDSEKAEPNNGSAPTSSLLNRWQWWVAVAANAVMLIVGQSTATLLGRFYYDQGGNSKWMATFVQSAGFPVLFIPYLLIPSSHRPRLTSVKVFSVYLGLGVLVAGDNMLYSTALLYLSASTYSLVCASQLAFNAVFSFFLNNQKFTFPILTSVVVLSFSAALIFVNEDTAKPDGVSKWQSILGLICCVGASALYSLYLSLTQLTFQRILKKETFAVVIQMQICVSMVATCVTTVGLVSSGESKTLHREMDGYGKGEVSYLMTLIWTALGWQICSVGLVGLIFIVSSLFSNVVSTVGLAVAPVAAVVFFHDKFNGTKIIAMLLAIYGFVSYGYQNYLDDQKRPERSLDRDPAGEKEPHQS